MPVPRLAGKISLIEISNADHDISMLPDWRLIIGTVCVFADELGIHYRTDSSLATPRQRQAQLKMTILDGHDKVLRYFSRPLVQCRAELELADRIGGKWKRGSFTCHYRKLQTTSFEKCGLFRLSAPDQEWQGC
jgi:hypothetical protein